MNFSDSSQPVFDNNSVPRRDILHGQIAAMDKNLSGDQFDIAYKRVCELYELRGRVYQEEIAAITEEIVQVASPTWQLRSLKTTLGTNVLPTATIVLIDANGEKITSQSTGYSSTDAICSAIKKATKIRVFLKDLWYSSISCGANSLGQAIVTAEYHNQQVRAKACSVDMLEAAAKAYLMAINIAIDRIIQQLD